MPRKTRASWGSNKPARRKGYRTLRYWADLHDGRGYMRHTMTVEGSKRDGDRKLAELRLLHGEDKPVPTLRECVERWYIPDMDRLSTNTRKMYRSTINSRIFPRWGDVPVTDIRPVEIQEWLLSMTESQAKLASKLMAVMLDYPTRYEIIASNPMRIKYRMPKGVVKRDAGTYTFDDAVALMRAAEGSYAEAAVLASLFGSCRVGESLSPMASEICEATAGNGMAAAYFELKRQVSNTGAVEESLKTAGSYRQIIFVGPVAERILAIRDERISDGLVWLNDNGCGDPVGQRPMTAEWHRITEAAGIPYHPYRNLRNSWRTFMEWELHVPTAQLEMMMGHKSADVTAAHYNRPTVQMFIDAVAEAYEAKGFTRA